MPSNNFQWINYPSFAGGYNSAQGASHIEDDEFSSILNFEFDLSDNLKARNGFAKYNSSPDFTSRLTSIFNFITSAGVGNIIVTTGNEIYKDTAGIFTSIKGGVALPTNTLWHWKAFNDLAIAATRGTPLTSALVKWNGAGTIASLTTTGIAGAPDKAKFLEVWNNRLWIVFDSHPNRVYFSTLGNPEDYAISGGFLEIDGNDGDRITGIKAAQKRLFVFKRNKISQVITGNNGKINTDPTGWMIELITDQGGCLSQFTIQVILNDVIFLSDDGVASLSAVQQFGDFQQGIISRKVKELSFLNNNIDSFYSAAFTPKALYLLSVPKTVGGTVNNRIYVFDYKKVGNQNGNKGRWTIFESSIINPAVLGVVQVNGKKTLFLGGDTPLFYLCKWDDTTVYSDNGQAVTKLYIGKAYNFSMPVQRKECNRMSLEVGFSKADLSSTVECRVNEDTSQTNTFNVSFPNTAITSLWDTAIWDVDKFAVSSITSQTVENILSLFRKGKTFQPKFLNQQTDQDIVIQNLAFEVTQLTQEGA